MASKPSLNRTDAVFIGLAAMLGAGVFVIWGEVAALAGPYLIPAVLIAGSLAYLNAMTIAQLASQVKGNGGTYAYARAYLNPTFGFLAGVAFIFGKVGSAAAIALTVGRYLFPGFEVPAALGAVVVMTAINLAGINRTALGSKVLAGVVLIFLTSLLISSFVALEPTGNGVLPPNPAYPATTFSVLTAASLMFFAFAGYARVATIAGEVKNAAQFVPAAIRISLAVVFTLYLLLGIFTSQRLGWQLAETDAPIAALAAETMPWLSGQIVATIAAIAALGSLLALLAGMSRTAAIMGKDRELPAQLAKLNANNTPWLAEVSIAVVIMLLLSTGDLLWMVGLSSFCILLYYAIANLAAIQQPKSKSLGRPKILNWLALFGCLAVAFAVPPLGLLTGAVLLSFAVVLRWALARLNRIG